MSKANDAKLGQGTSKLTRSSGRVQRFPHRLLAPPPLGGPVSSVRSSPVARLACFESIGRTRPAAQYWAQGKVLPRGAGPSGEDGGGTEAVVSVCFAK